MAYRCGDRYQQTLLPKSIEDYVVGNDPVRAYDAFIEAMNMGEIGIKNEPHKVGNASYEPRAMIKLLVYGCSYGIHSSRKLERALHHNISFMWLMGGLTPDHKTIAEFRRNNKGVLAEVIKQCARICLKMGLIEGNVLFLDGTKIRANASSNKSYTEKYYKELDKRIEAELEKAERLDEAESNEGSYVRVKDLGVRVKKVLAELEGDNKTKNGKDRMRNITDIDSRLMRTQQGREVCYNVQNVVDEKHGLIVDTQAESKANDAKQFAKQIRNAEKTLNRKSEIACADAGYANTSELAKIDEQGTKVIVPSQRQALHEGEKPFSKSEFTYDKKRDCYYCPEGEKLKCEAIRYDVGKMRYRVTGKNKCSNCKHFGVCTKSNDGRRIIRLVQEELKEKFEKQYEQNQHIYIKRKTLAERPFGHIKHNLGKRYFLMRGQKGVQAEISLAATCFNIVRMLTICGGTQKLMEAMTAVS
jgi:transposase